MRKHIICLALVLMALMPLTAASSSQSQPNVQEVQMQQPKTQPEDPATKKADEEASEAEEKADKASPDGDASADATEGDTMTDDMIKDAVDQGAADEDKPAAQPGQEEDMGIYKSLKTKFIEGNAGFMSLVALALVIGLAFCIERIIYLSLSEINAKKFMENLDSKISSRDIEGAKDLCRNTRGPVASICYQGLARIHETLDDIERSVVSYGSVQSANLEKGCSWITLFIAMAPSLGFLGTVIGMVMAFDQIQAAGDISPTIVAAGMKVALITTIFGIIVALILQIFYNYILSKIEHITAQMEESAITLLDSIAKYKLTGEQNEQA